jgi:hypothetical protein
MEVLGVIEASRILVSFVSDSNVRCHENPKQKVLQWLEVISNSSEQELVQFLGEYVLFKCVTIWRNQMHNGEPSYSVENINNGIVCCASLCNLTIIIKQHGRRLVAPMMRRSHFAMLRDSQDRSVQIKNEALNWAIRVVHRITCGLSSHLRLGESNLAQYCNSQIPSVIIPAHEISVHIEYTLNKINGIVLKKAKMRQQLKENCTH